MSLFKRSLPLIGLALLLLALILSGQHAAVAQEAYQTPTALPDGRVIYKVVPGDSCLRIELITGIKVEELRRLNKLDPACSIQPDQELILAIVQPTATPTLAPGVTATSLLPSGTPHVGTGEICVVLFADINGDAARQESEPAILDGAVSVTNRENTISRTGITGTGSDAVCFGNVPEGEYNVSVAVPDGYNPTTTMAYPLKLIAGNRSVIDFGAQAGSRPPSGADAAAQQPAARSPLLLIAGGALILAALGLAVYFRFIKR